MPPALAQNPLSDEYRRARLCVSIALALFVLTIPSLIASLTVMNSVTLKITNGVTITMFALVPVLMRFTGSLVFTANTLALLLTVILTFMIVSTGGVGSGFVTALYSVPLIALQVLGKRFALMWLVVTIGSVAVLTMLELRGTAFPMLWYPPDQAVFVQGLIGSSIIIGVVVFTWLLETSRQAVQKELERARDSVALEVEEATAELRMANEEIQRQLNTQASQARELEQAGTALRQKNAEFLAAKEQAELALEQVEHTHRLKNEFLSNVSHEIRTPITAILGFAEILQDYVAEPQAKQFLAQIEHSGRNLLALFTDMLDLSTMEAGRMKILPTATELEHLVNYVQLSFAAQAEAKQLMFAVHPSANLPTIVMLDAVRVRQILNHLVSNAVKFTEQGSIITRFWVESASDTTLHSCADVVIEVEDTGCGIAPEMQTVIFDAFRQQDGANTRRYGGLGLGLAVTKELVHIMGGTIHLSSEVHKGSRFTVRLRNVQVLEVTKEAAPTTSAVLSATASFLPEHSFNTPSSNATSTTPTAFTFGKDVMRGEQSTIMPNASETLSSASFSMVGERFLAQWSEIVRHKDNIAIEEFAVELQEFSVMHGLHYLAQYSTALHQAALHFKLTQMNTLFDRFPEVLHRQQSADEQTLT